MNDILLEIVKFITMVVFVTGVCYFSYRLLKSQEEDDKKNIGNKLT